MEQSPSWEANQFWASQVHNSNTFQPLEGHLQEVKLIHSSSMDQQNESPVVKLTLVCSSYCVTQQLYVMQVLHV